MSSAYLATEEGICAELNTWAAWVEATVGGPVQEGLMLHLISTRQLFVMRDPPAEYVDACAEPWPR